jgi:hypothetical protein
MMEQKLSLQMMADKIQLMKKTAQELAEMAEYLPFLYRNSCRILASTKMLELNISDIKDLED